MKVMFNFFFDFNGILQYDFLPPGQTILLLSYFTLESYDKIARICGELIHDNCTAASYTLLLFREFFVFDEIKRSFLNENENCYYFFNTPYISAL